jgi:multimeric flavodoxin WrbA
MTVLGIDSSPIKNGNTAFILDYALEEAAKAEAVTTEAVALAGLSITDCRHCNWCMTKQTPEKLCSIEDDVSPILQKIRDCNVLILASPVYFSRLWERWPASSTGPAASPSERMGIWP